MPKDDPKPPPISVEELLAGDDGPKPGIMYLTRTDFGGVKMTENNTCLGPGPDPHETPLPARERKHSAEDYAKAKAVKRAMEARAKGQRLSASVLDVFRAGYRPDHVLASSKPAAEITTSPGGRAPISAPAQTVRRHRGWLLAAGAVVVTIAVVLVARGAHLAASSHPTASDPVAIPAPVRSSTPINVRTEALDTSQAAPSTAPVANRAEDRRAPPRLPMPTRAGLPPGVASASRVVAPTRVSTAPLAAPAADVAPVQTARSATGASTPPAADPSPSPGVTVSTPVPNIIFREYSSKRIDPQ